MPGFEPSGQQMGPVGDRAGEVRPDPIAALQQRAGRSPLFGGHPHGRHGRSLSSMQPPGGLLPGEAGPAARCALVRGSRGVLRHRPRRPTAGGLGQGVAPGAALALSRRRRHRPLHGGASPSRSCCGDVAGDAEGNQPGGRGGGDQEMPRCGNHQDPAGPQAGRMGAPGAGRLISRCV